MMASAVSDRACGVIGGNDRSYSVNGNGGSNGVIGGGTGGVVNGGVGASAGGHHFESFYPFSQTRSGILASTPRGISPETHAPSEIRSPPPGFENVVPESSQAHSIRIKNMPSGVTRRDISNILLFAKDLQDVRMISEGAIAVFGSYESAVQAQQCLDGKPVDSFGGKSVLSVQLVDKDREILDLGPLSPGSSPTSEGLGAGYTTNHPLFSRAIGVGAIGSSNGGLMNGNNGGGNGVIGGGGANNAAVGGNSQNVIGSGVGSIGGVSDNSFYEQQSFLQQLPPYHRQAADCDDVDDRAAAMGPRNRSLTNPLAINGPSRMPHLPQLSTAGTGFMSTPHHITSPINNNLVSPTSWLSNSSHSPHPRNLPAANPADQNPPCNTLYVGNLPVNTTEDELKSLFSRQRGYKRLMLKPKPQGPMCFVEFEDIDFATKALADLYGRSLSNSVKGGIRLSFSKNPLGVRSSGNNVHAPTPIGTSLLTGGSGSAGGSQFPFTTAVHNPPGLPAPANRQMSPGVYDQGQPGQGFGITPFGVPGGYYSHGR